MGSDGKLLKNTSGIGVAATRREKAAMIDEVKEENLMLKFAILTLSFIHASFYLFSIHALLIAHAKIQSEGKSSAEPEAVIILGLSCVFRG